ncbi:hypothetical protein [Amycolatopsis orientalis]|uniref:hypothetical protein n=1 Tax=Amycolatopsis orientalis TaxID=31958 RepID=UPI000406CEA9|nr:hypothetical protein [Amycolatopsis orientalis]
MNSKLAASAVGILLGAGALIGTAAPAFADNSARITGALAVFTPGGDVFRLYDTACDGDPVYLKYWIHGRETRHDHSGGCGTHATYNLNLNRGVRVEFQACRNVRFAPDSCSGKATAIA